MDRKQIESRINLMISEIGAEALYEMMIFRHDDFLETLNYYGITEKDFLKTP